MRTPKAKSPPPPASIWRERFATLAVGSALFLLFIDQTALTTALPVLARALNSDPVQLKLTLTAYMLIQAALLPASGWLADRFGARRVFLISMAVFIAGSVLCAMAKSLGDLVFYRLIQGVGAAAMVPLGRIIIVGATTRENLVKAMMLYTLPAVIGPILGPPLTGLILKVASWPWIFLINVPFGLIGMWAIAAYVPKLSAPHPGKFDGLGFLLAAITISAAMLVAETVGFSLIPWQVQAASAVIAGVCGVALWRHLNTAPRPVLDMKLMRYPTFRLSLLGGIFVRIGFGAAPFLLPLMLQEGLGWSAWKTGIVITAAAIGAIAARLIGPAVLRRWGFRDVLVVATVLFGLTTGVAAAFGHWTPTVVIVVILLVNGLMRALMFTSINTIAYDETPRKEVSAASTLYAVVQQLALSFGVTLGALLLQMARSGADGALTPDRFILPFLVIGVVSMAGAIWFRRLSPDTGAGMAGGGTKAAPSPVT
ncbi:MAG: MFS transporter [Caulobacteraceae bacterium]